MKCFLDMDGVLTDFVGAICKARKCADPYDIPSSHGQWNMEKLLKINEEEFYGPCDNTKFWSEMDWAPHGAAILNRVIEEFGKENIIILTRPTRHPASAMGKLEWLQKNIPSIKYLLGNCSKEELVGTGRVLIDDYDKNVDDWRSAGGIAIQVPRKWNRLHAVACQHHTLSYVDDTLTKITRSFFASKVYPEKIGASDEVRITDPTTGGQKGTKEAAFHLIMPQTLWELAEHNGKGAKKYSSYNWARGYNWSLSYAALQRHLNQFWGGEDIDSETGSKHVIAAMWHCMSLAYFMNTKLEMDDRPKENQQ